MRVGRRGNGNLFRIEMIVVILILSAGQTLGFQSQTDGDLIGKQAPSFSLQQPTGGSFSLDGAFPSAKCVLISMWGVRCGACLEEMKHLNLLAKKYAKDGFLAVGVNVDGIDAPTLKDQMGKMGINPEYTVVADPEFVVGDAYRMETAPLSFIIDSNGKIAARHDGFENGDEKELEREIRKVLGLPLQ